MQTQDYRSGNSFIDDNHELLLLQLKDLGENVGNEWDYESFKSSVDEFIISLENHFHHEEIILKGANYENLNTHIEKHSEISLGLRIGASCCHNSDSAVKFLATSRNIIFSHELLEDQSYWPVLEPEGTNTDELISWSSELETGHSETDEHHKSIINHMNRFHQRLVSTDAFSGYLELENLHTYSQIHFLQEERELGKKLRPGHKANHKRLLSDLSLLITEIEAGNYKMENLGSYLKYWLLNHIQTFDIPAFKRNTQDDLDGNHHRK